MWVVLVGAATIQGMTATTGRLSRRTVVVLAVVGVLMLVVAGVFAGRAWADAQRYDRCVTNAGTEWTPESVDALCSMEPGAELVPAG